MRSCHEAMTPDEGGGQAFTLAVTCRLTLLYISSNHNTEVWRFTHPLLLKQQGHQLPT